MKSGKDKTAYMLFETRLKVGRSSLGPHGAAQVFASFSLHDKTSAIAYA